MTALKKLIRDIDRLSLADLAAATVEDFDTAAAKLDKARQFHAAQSTMFKENTK